jgi:hypothetical protein
MMELIRTVFDAEPPITQTSVNVAANVMVD